MNSNILIGIPIKSLDNPMSRLSESISLLDRKKIQLNLIKNTVTVNYGTTVDAGGDVNVDQKGTYDMNGNIISGDNTTIQSGGAKIGIDKDTGFTLDYRISDKDTISANSKTGVKVKQNDEYGNIVSTKNVP